MNDSYIWVQTMGLQQNKQTKYNKRKFFRIIYGGKNSGI